MPSNRKYYKDIEKWREVTKLQKRRYYNARRKPPCKWTDEESQMVLEHSMSDTELSKIINHGVAAIQQHRSLLKKKMNETNKTNESNEAVR